MIHDERRYPFFMVGHVAYERVRSRFPGSEFKTAWAVYGSLCYLASCAYADGGGGSFAGGRKEIAATAQVKAETVDKVTAGLIDVGLLEKRRRTDEAGREIAPVWTLVERALAEGGGVPPERGPRSPVGAPREGTPKRAHVERPLDVNATASLLGSSVGSGSTANEEGNGDSAAARDDAEKKADPRGALPPDFPPELVEHARAVFRVLREVARQHAAPEPTPLAVGRLLVAYPRRPVVSAAHEFASWAADPPRPIRNVVSSYTNWLKREPDLACTEPLPGEAPPGPPAGVVPIRGEHKSSRRIRELEEHKRRLEAQGL